MKPSPTLPPIYAARRVADRWVIEAPAQGGPAPTCAVSLAGGFAGSTVVHPVRHRWRSFSNTLCATGGVGGAS